MDVRIRTATQADAAGIASIIREMGWFVSVNAETEAETVERITAVFEKAENSSSYVAFVAETAEEIVGFAALHVLPYLIHTGNDGYLSELFIRESARGQGVGTALLQTVQDEARRRGCFRLRLINVKTRDSYQRGFYAKNGWEEWPDAATFVYRMDK
ncbi:hypothetical protein U14_03536 [Candidatus Moduliflexus flocculans]|uniref:N-acetyltransferase domain-containing protein n=1 Tax=Candidatus Moduliflexus flocculans TaxID=1499966 RepID=A0A081BPG9_9BACT|nr:hypothetical protein U14_03536 [Candidatus Moduliflexus flocculans]